MANHRSATRPHAGPSGAPAASRSAAAALSDGYPAGAAPGRWPCAWNNLSTEGSWAAEGLPGSCAAKLSGNIITLLRGRLMFLPAGASAASGLAVGLLLQVFGVTTALHGDLRCGALYGAEIVRCELDRNGADVLVQALQPAGARDR